MNLFDNNGGTRLDYDTNSYNLGDGLFYITNHDTISKFTIDFHRPIYRLGFEIYKMMSLYIQTAHLHRLAT